VSSFVIFSFLKSFGFGIGIVLGFLDVVLVVKRYKKGCAYFVLWI